MIRCLFSDAHLCDGNNISKCCAIAIAFDSAICCCCCYLTSEFHILYFKYCHCMLMMKREKSTHTHTHSSVSKLAELSRQKKKESKNEFKLLSALCTVNISVLIRKLCVCELEITLKISEKLIFFSPSVVNDNSNMIEHCAGKKKKMRKKCCIRNSFEMMAFWIAIITLPFVISRIWTL